MRKRRWDDRDMISAIRTSTSVRQVLQKLGLVEAGGNYEQVKSYIYDNRLSTRHFTGRGWNKGKRVPRAPILLLRSILVQGSRYQSYKLKKRLFADKMKVERCELCGWADRAEDGRIPLELDHKNGDRYDNRIENLRILCPNCHSLQPTHRGKNKKKG